MKDKRDYKAALEHFEYAINETGERFTEPFDGFEGDVLAALSIADRLQRGEVSDEMYDAFADYIEPDYIDFVRGDVAELFKAMITQMLKEIEDDR